MIPQSISKTLTSAANTTTIAAGQLVSAGANFTLNGASVSGGVATLDAQRRVLITSTGNDGSVTFTVRGTNAVGNPILESIAGGSATGVYTNLDFKTVTQVSASAQTTTASVGTNTIGSSLWHNVNTHVSPADIGVSVVTSGTVNYTVQYTYDDPNLLPSSATYPIPFNHISLASQTATLDGVIQGTVWGLRLLVNSGTGSARMDWVQAGISGP